MLILLPPALEGFFLGLGIILAIGAQNAFVLRQGIDGRHVRLVCLICAISDALLIAAGVAGFGALLAELPGFPTIMSALGAGFLLWYGTTRFRAALRAHALVAAERAVHSRRVVVAQCLAFTWLNPHVYLDTVVIIGAASLRQVDAAKAAFAAGAIVASFVFFFSLGFLARLLAPILRRPAVWRVIDIAIGVLMWIIAAGLLRYAWEHA